ncbi:hypothetical protein BJ165DRAFT_1512265 [Panaeolus papilionaceus]|nr:hypothetical protein BJ165DRAFT_1512265 [Panaeolus papilionaceus]
MHLIRRYKHSILNTRPLSLPVELYKRALGGGTSARLGVLPGVDLERGAEGGFFLFRESDKRREGDGDEEGKREGREAKNNHIRHYAPDPSSNASLPLLEQTGSPLNTLSSRVQLYSNTVPPCSGTGQLPVPRCRDRSAGEGRLRGCLGVMGVPQDLEGLCLVTGRGGMRRGDGGRRREELKGYTAEALVVVGAGYGEIPVGIYGVSRGGRRGGAPLRDRDVVLYVLIGRIMVLTTFWTRL